MRVAQRIVRGNDCGDAWTTATEMLLQESDRQLLHLIVQITHPGEDNPPVRAAADALLIQRGLPPVSTVVNTLFPAALARAAGSPEELTRRYREMYQRIRAELPTNRRGTYFGRLVAHPSDGRQIDQLDRIISRLRGYGARKGSAAAVYEASLATANDELVSPALTDDRPVDGQHAPVVVLPRAEQSGHTLVDGLDAMTTSAPIYTPRSDAMPLGFPCLSHISFQNDAGTLHALAHYRSQYLVRRGYGNYLAVGLLQRFIADAAGLDVGELTVAVGLATVEGPVGVVEQALAGITQLSLPGVAPVPALHR